MRADNRYIVAATVIYGIASDNDATNYRSVQKTRRVIV